jgi:xanthine dehydrogenase accessory factor
MTDWITTLARLSAEGCAAVMVTVLRAQGSTPREAGAKMIVWEAGSHGSVGGGHLELEALRIARELLAANEGGEGTAPVVRDFALGPSLGQCCGGATSLLFERVAPPGWRVAVFGAGHVGKALVKLLADLPCRVTWIDPRAEEFPDALPGRVERVVPEQAEDAVVELPPGADAVVMTHSHQIDFQIVEALLRRPELGYVGLIGSRTKRERFLKRLVERGRAPEELARLTCPIGVPGIRGKLPAEIAVAVAAELLQRRGAAVGTGRAGHGEERRREG